MFANLGPFKLGVSNVMQGPTAASETLSATINEHKVVRGKPVPQLGGQELDKRSFSFFFDESFCNPEAEYTKLKAAQALGTVMPLIFGFGGYGGKSYQIKSTQLTVKKTTEHGRVVRLEASISLVEVPNSVLSLLGSAVASTARALTNPLIKR
ncbi:phage tail protein [Flexibacterium corallicola]|uniref:phage tail protein n=1 Tax=Flexibacterium corallicola TaxID=3037259 RepID=UPI00286EB6B5|nr:phage tail protein [Pseudovibrio sp. M1P-2-3]